MSVKIKNYNQMKKILIMMMMSLVMIGCQKKVDLGALTLGQSTSETKAVLSYNNIELREDNDSIVRGLGKIQIMGIEWDDIICEFKYDRLISVATCRKFSTLPNYQIEDLKGQLRELCGDGYTNSEKMITIYGTSSNNKGCLGAIKVEWDFINDKFYASIRYPD